MELVVAHQILTHLGTGWLCCRYAQTILYVCTVNSDSRPDKINVCNCTQAFKHTKVSRAHNNQIAVYSGLRRSYMWWRGVVYTLTLPQAACSWNFTLFPCFPYHFLTAHPNPIRFVAVLVMHPYKHWGCVVSAEAKALANTSGFDVVCVHCAIPCLNLRPSKCTLHHWICW